MISDPETATQDTTPKPHPGSVAVSPRPGTPADRRANSLSNRQLKDLRACGTLTVLKLYPEEFGLAPGSGTFFFAYSLKQLDRPLGGLAHAWSVERASRGTIEETPASRSRSLMPRRRSQQPPGVSIHQREDVESALVRPAAEECSGCVRRILVQTTIDDVRKYRRAMSGDEIATLVGSPVGISDPTPGSHLSPSGPAVRDRSLPRSPDAAEGDPALRSVRSSPDLSSSFAAPSAVCSPPGKKSARLPLPPRNSAKP
jgi:hypothetical protein